MRILYVLGLVLAVALTTGGSLTAQPYPSPGPSPRPTPATPTPTPTPTPRPSPSPGAAALFVARLAGRFEVPPVTTEARGQATFRLTNATTMTFRVTVSNITNVTAAHIHLGAPGQNGPVVVTLFPGPTRRGPFDGLLAEGTITAASLSGPLAGQPLAALVRRMREGQTYVNVHTTAHPGGEIRGHVQATAR